MMPPLLREPAVRRLLPAIATVVVIALAAGVVIGRLVGDVTVGPAPEGEPEAAADGHIHMHGGDGGGDTSGSTVTGQSVSAGGYTLVPDDNVFELGSETLFGFHIADGNGVPVTEYMVQHEKRMHLFAMRLDMSGYQHVHPDMSDDGTWAIELDFTRPGPWRVIADFVVDGADPVPLTLGVDVTVPGDYQPADLPEATNPDVVADYDVTLDFVPSVQVSSPLLLTVQADGGAVELEPYLGAYGHLVVLRSGDLGFLHVHPDSERIGDALRFWTTLPSAGDYRLFFEFQVDGRVQRAEFTLNVD
ncbi:MAG TPA: hypothetical protein H9881_10375 [Candidatus Stackebrandtia excrementipullorum]|nr:hypothetical protein [Candidatus Stackebrandtia excrementipullorum]